MLSIIGKSFNETKNRKDAESAEVAQRIESSLAPLHSNR
jgi:hypothetical protein